MTRVLFSLTNAIRIVAIVYTNFVNMMVQEPKFIPILPLPDMKSLLPKDGILFFHRKLEGKNMISALLLDQLSVIV